MVEQDPRAKYRTLPSTIDVADTVADVDATTTDAELAALRDPDAGADPYLRAVGWIGPR
jgi:hypothetical protein